MKKNYLITILVLSLFCLIFFAFKPATNAKTYQYLMINVSDNEMEEVYVSIDGKEYKQLNFKKQSKGDSDVNPILNLIHQYENEGWVLTEILDEDCSCFMKKEVD